MYVERRIRKWEEGYRIGVGENKEEFTGGDILMLDESDHRE